MSARKASRPPGITGLSIFFAAAAIVSFASVSSLIFPDSALEIMWQIKPAARDAFASMGIWSIFLLIILGASCEFAAVGLWTAAPCGRWLALALLMANGAGDLLRAVVTNDIQTALGVPVVGALVGYLFSREAREFASS